MNVAPNDFVFEKQTMKCMINQISANSSDAITGNKLKGLTKDYVTHCLLMKKSLQVGYISSYVSRVETIKGLFLLKGLRLKAIKPLSKDYLVFVKRMKKMRRLTWTEPVNRNESENVYLLLSVWGQLIFFFLFSFFIFLCLIWHVIERYG